MSTPLPPVEDLPILPPLDPARDVALAVNEVGDLFLFHEKPFPEPVAWAEYDVAAARLHLVGEEGRMQDIGMTIHEPVAVRMAQSTEIYLIQVVQNKGQETNSQSGIEKAEKVPLTIL